MMICMIYTTRPGAKCGANLPPKPILPKWVFDTSTPESLEDAAFVSGSALALLHVTVADPAINVPTELLRNKLALRAAINCLKIEGRMVTEVEIRDAFLLTLENDEMGPAGDMLAFWHTRLGATYSRVLHSGVASSGGGSAISLKHGQWQERLQALLPEEMQEQVSGWLDETQDTMINPVSAALAVMVKILKQYPRQEAVALLCADVVLADVFGWEKPLPLFGLYLSRKTLRAASEGEDIRIVCHVSLARAAQDAIRLAHDLVRRAVQLRSIEPKLRTKGSQNAVRLFLSEDAVYPPTMLSPFIKGSNTPMTARSARRLCDRLVELGVVRELTGRKTFRLYGVA